MHDVRLLLWLRARHAGWTLNRVLNLAGASVDDGRLLDRAYQFYLLALMLAWFVLTWAALLDAVAAAFALAGGEAAVLAVRCALAAPAAVLVAGGAGALRSSPLKLSHADIAHLAASPISARALVGTASSLQALAGAMCALACGYVVGVGVRAAELAVEPFAFATVLALLAAFAVAGRWVAGVVRLGRARWRLRQTALAAAVLALLAILWCALAFAVASSALVEPASLAVFALGAAAAGVGAVLALAAAAPRIDMTAVIGENALFADLCRFDVLSPLDQNAIAEYRRRRKLAERTVRFSLPGGRGRAALASHALLSHLRQYDGLPVLLMHGALVVPLGVLAIAGAGGPVLFLFWLQALVMFAQGAREATRTFRDDVRNRLVRDRLPYSLIELLVFDSLPAFALTTLVSWAVVAALAPTGMPLAAAFALAALLNAVTLLCCGLDAVRLFSGGPRACYEYGVLALAGTTFALALFASASAAIAGSALVAAAVAALLRFGVECAR